MSRFLRDLRTWWRWRNRQGRLHLFGIAEFRMVGTVTGVATPFGYKGPLWTVEGGDGRMMYVAVEESPMLQLGDRVEIEPIYQASPVIFPVRCSLVRNLGPNRGQPKN